MPLISVTGAEATSGGEVSSPGRFLSWVCDVRSLRDDCGEDLETGGGLSASVAVMKNGQKAAWRGKGLFQFALPHHSLWGSKNRQGKVKNETGLSWILS